MFIHSLENPAGSGATHIRAAIASARLRCKPARRVARVAHGKAIHDYATVSRPKDRTATAVCRVQFEVSVIHDSNA
jgi:hypothetical protein